MWLLAMLACVETGCVLGDCDETLDQGHTSDTADTEPIVVDCIGEVMEQDQTWSGVVEVGCTLNVRSHLIVEPGTVVRLVAGGGLVFADGGSIDAVGDVDRPITMTSDGGFASLVFLEPDVPSTLAFVNVSGGGVPGIVYGEGMAIVGDSAFAAGNVSIRDCVFEGSASVGIDLRWGKASIERTRVVGSVGPSVVTSLELAPALAADLDVDGDVILDPTDVVEGRPVALAALAVPWHLRQTVSVWSPMTVPAGATFEMEPGVSLRVGATERFAGSMAFEGTADRPITVRGSGQSPWESVTFATSDPANRMSHVRLSGGGAPSAFGVGALVTLDVNAAGSLEIRDCVLEGSAGYGLAVDGQHVNDDVQTANTFQNNAEGDIRW